MTELTRASVARLALEAAVFQCLEAEVLPKTIRTTVITSLATEEGDEAGKTYERLVAEETLILDATEDICRVMGPNQDSGKVTRKELAKRLGCGKSHVTQLLSGERNLTLRSLAQMAHALGHRVEVSLSPIPASPSQKEADDVAS